MIDYTVFDRATGEVLFAGTSEVPGHLSTAQLGVLEGVQYEGGWLDGEIHHELPPQPSQHHVWDWQTKAWADPRTLADLQAAKWAEIKAARDAAERMPLVTPIGTFDADPKGRTNLTDTILLLQSLAAIGQPANIDFTLADNTVVTLSLAQMVQVGIALGLQVQGAYNTGRQLRGLIEAATTAQQLEAIVWPAP